jgi:hypothetical protein
MLSDTSHYFLGSYATQSGNSKPTNVSGEPERSPSRQAKRETKWHGYVETDRPCPTVHREPVTAVRTSHQTALPSPSEVQFPTVAAEEF